MASDSSDKSNSGDVSRLTLSQAVLAPINSILQAQVHASRSFLNLVLQMGFGHKDIDDNGNATRTADAKENDTLYQLEFIQEKSVDGKLKKYKVSLPYLAALPLNALVIEEAEVQFSMTLDSKYKKQRQFSKAGKKAIPSDGANYNDEKRPWHLVDNPVDLVGVIGDKSSNGAKIDIRMKVGKGEVPAELSKFIAATSDFSVATDITPDEKEENNDNENTTNGSTE